MAARRSFMGYLVWFRDQALYDFAVSLGQYGIIAAPDTVAGIFGLGTYPAWPTGDVTQLPVSISFSMPWFPGFILPQSTTAINAVDLEYYVPCQPGNPASIWPCPGDDSHDNIYTWQSIWIWQAGAGAGSSPPPSPNPSPQRRWIDGAESDAFLEGGIGSNQNLRVRCASRVVGGRGYAFRGSATASSFPNHSVAQYRTGLTTKTSWERFYVRFLSLDGNATIWRCHNSVQNAAGQFLRWMSTGEVNVIDNTGFGVERPQGTLFTPTIGMETWYKIDVFIKYGDGTVGSGLARYIVNDGDVADETFTSPDNSGISLNGFHDNSDLGPSISGNDDSEYDIDDWINADLPGHIDSTTLEEIPGEDPPVDFSVGSHVRVHWSDSDTVTSTNWTGNKAAVNQSVSPNTQLTSTLVSATSGARLEGITDIPALDVVDTEFPTLGVVAAVIGTFGSNSGNTDGQLGYKIAGGADVLTTIDQTAAPAADSVAYQPSGNDIPVEIAPFHVVHTKSVDANTDTTYALSASAEHLGTWGPEDTPGFAALGPRNYLHNAPFFNNLVGWYSGGTYSPCIAYGFTFVGNGTYQEFTLPAPAHFIRIRNTAAAGSGGITWFSSGQAAVVGAGDRTAPNFRVWTDFITGDCILSVAGNDVEANQNAVTYQVIVFCDPGMRFLLCDQFVHSSGATQPRTNNLLFSDFTPECVFASEQVVGSVSGNPGLSFKGTGHSGNTGNLLNGNSLANWGTFATGVISSRSDLHAGLSQTLACWRSSEPGCAGTMVQICTYTGNGASPRNITLTPTSGRVPLWVLVVPAAAAVAIARDPSHTGSNSAQWTGTNSTTGITAVAIDQITVGSSLNTNLTVYNVLAICGDTAGMLNGTYQNLYCDLPVGGPFNAPSEYVPGPNVVGDGGIVLGGGAGAPITLLKDVSGIYTLVENKRNDTLMDRQTGQSSVDVEIPDPTFKTGYIGG